MQVKNTIVYLFCQLRQTKFNNMKPLTYIKNNPELLLWSIVPAIWIAIGVYNFIINVL